MNGWGYVAIFLIVILLVAAVIFLILWLTKKPATTNINKELAISGVRFNLLPSNVTTTMDSSNMSAVGTSTRTVQATWESVGNSGDQVTLYADTKQINLNPNGIPEDPTSALLYSSPPVPGTSRSVRVSGLQPNTLYYLMLVVTNPSVSGSNPVPGRVYTSDAIPPGQFIISDLDINGSIIVNSDNTVTYSDQVKGVNDIFTYDNNRGTLNVRGVGNQSNSDIVLYNNNGTLAAASYASINDKSSATWMYQNNQWCLKPSTSITTSAGCMDLNPQTNVISVRPSANAKWQNLPLAQPSM